MIRHKNPQPLLLLSIFLLLNFNFNSISAIDFVFNGFNTSDVLLYGNATIDSRILTLTHQQSFSIGRALYPQKIPTKNPNSTHVYPFSTSFIFAMAPFEDTLPGHGLVFIFTPVTGIQGTSSAQHLGLFNLTNNGNASNHVFGVEFDVFMNQEFDDINANHVGIDLNSLKSFVSLDAGYWPSDGEEEEKSFQELVLNDGENYQVWIDYEDSLINVTMAPVGMKRPSRPLLNVSLNLSQVFEDEMFVGFTSATGQLVQSHKILAWSFSNTNFSLSEELVTIGLPSFVLPGNSIFKSKGFVAGFTVGIFFVICVLVLLALFLIRRKRRREREREEMEDWELEYWPHRMAYEEIEASTKGFSEENVIGVGGNGKVYKGALRGGGVEVAVKRISHENDGVREFLAEISSLGRLKQRNLVGLRGWCKKDAGNFLLVYEYMENGSLDKRVFDCDESKMLNCEDRIRILKDVAFAVLYLHEGWEAKVVHRDIKASNVLLDKDMNGRLGDFGLARLHSHGQIASTTKLVGTVGYMAPEVIKTGRASTETDVYMFGVLILEVMCGRRPLEEGKPPLVEWVWNMMAQGQLVSALDQRLRDKGEFNVQEVERVLHLGLLCAYPEPKSRPTMRQAVNILEGKNEGEESEIANMDTYLLQQLRSRDILSEYSQYFKYASHPTFQDIRNSSSVSLTWSNSLVDGR